MPKITVHGGASNWDGNPTSTSLKTHETKPEEVNQSPQVPAPMMESHSEKDQTGSSSASPMDGNGQEMVSDEIARLLNM